MSERFSRPASLVPGLNPPLLASTTLSSQVPHLGEARRLLPCLLGLTFVQFLLALLLARSSGLGLIIPSPLARGQTSLALALV
jgi:hypothetical protein